MDLGAYLDHRFQNVRTDFRFGFLERTRAFGTAVQWIRNERRTTTTLASFVCQAAVIWLRGAAAAVTSERDIPEPSDPIMVNPADRFALLLFDRDSPDSGAEGRVVRLFRDVGPEMVRQWYDLTIRDLYRRRSFTDPERGEALRIEEIAGRFAEDPAFLRSLAELHAIVMPQPRTVRTHVPDPAWRVSQTRRGDWWTAGLLVTDRKGRHGVTAALHGFGEPYPEVGSPVRVGDSVGTLEEIDPLSDSCFISLPKGAPTNGGVPVAGVLSGHTPGQGEQVRFVGAHSGRQTATIVGLDPFITVSTVLSQKKLYTNAVTEVGDSGAALIDGRDHVIGFALERTGLDAPIEYAAWVWGDLVMKRLGLSPMT